MFVRFLDGPRKGNVEEMKYADARLLIADGRAEDAYAEKPAAQAPKCSTIGCGHPALAGGELCEQCDRRTAALQPSTAPDKKRRKK